jgi:glycerophosphoryl diester phosphodiesterase
VEKALRDGNRGDWPLITLNLDLKSEEPEHLAAIWQLLSQYQDWLTTATRTENLETPQPFEVRPILVLTGESDEQKSVFYDHVPIGSRLLAFGAVRTNTADSSAPPEKLAPHGADNYHRWWNNSWHVVEPEGQSKAGAWNAQKEARLDQLVQHAHAHNLYIRFYTLDGAEKSDLSCNGWFSTYNFGSKHAVLERWTAAIKAGADYIATDQYEQLSALLAGR